MRWVLLIALVGCDSELETPETGASPDAGVDSGSGVDGGDAAVAVDASRRGPLAFAAALPDLAEAPMAGEVRDAVAFDVDADGDPDLVLATDDGLRVLVNDGGARFTLATVPGAEPDAVEPLRPGGRGDIRDLALGVVGPDHTPALLACTGAASELLLGPGAGGLEPIQVLPARMGRCRAAAFADLDGDGSLEVATVVAREGQVGLWVIRGIDGRPALEERFTPRSEDTLSAGEARSNDEAATLRFERTPAGVAEAALAITAAEARAVFVLSASLPELPDEIRLRLGWEGDPAGIHLRVVDAGGVRYDSPPVAVGAALGEVSARDPASWVRVGEGEPAPPALPLTAIELVVTVAEPGAGVLTVDDVLALREGSMPRLVADFEARRPLYELAEGSAILPADLNRDGVDDLLVPRGASAPMLLMGSGGRLLPSREVALGGPGDVRAGAVLDADGDGNVDVALVAVGGRDRLLVGDGNGHLLDATEGSMPVDWAPGRSVVARDVDGDGIPDLVVGNDVSTDRLYLGRGDGRFRDETPVFGFDELGTAALVVADLDGDGDLDVASVPRAGDARALLRIQVTR